MTQAALCDVCRTSPVRQGSPGQGSPSQAGHHQSGRASPVRQSSPSRERNSLQQSSAAGNDDGNAKMSDHVRVSQPPELPYQATSAEQKLRGAMSTDRKQQSMHGMAVGLSSSSPARSASPNRYLARLGHAAQSSSAAKSGNAVAAAHRPASAAKLGNVVPVSSAPGRHQPSHGSHVRAAAAGSSPHDVVRKSSSSGSPSQGRLVQAASAQPNFIRTLRDWGLGPRKSAPLTQPMWQPYDRHVTPERDSARQGRARKALAQKALALQKLSNSADGVRLTSSGRSQSTNTRVRFPTPVLMHSSTEVVHPATIPRNVHSGSKIPWDSSVQDRTASRSRPAEGPAEDENPNSPDILQATLFTPVALKPSLPGQRRSRSSSPSHVRDSFGIPALDKEEKKSKQGKGAPRQASARPYRAGQLATAALQTKQAAWEHTRTHSLPSLLSQVTELLHCNSEPLLLLPERSATELMYAASPQLGQSVGQPSTAVACQMNPEEEVTQDVATAAANFDCTGLQNEPWHDPSHDINISGAVMQ